MDVWIVSTFWLLWIMLLWTWVYMYLFEPLLSGLWSYLEVELLNHMAILCLTFWGIVKLFQNSCTIFYSHLQCLMVPISSHPWQHFLFSVFHSSHSTSVSLFWFALPSWLETPDEGRQRSWACCSPWGFRELTTMTSNSEHLFMCILDICISSLRKCLKSFAYFWMGFGVFLLLSCRILFTSILWLVFSVFW